MNAAPVWFEQAILELSQDVLKNTKDDGEAIRVMLSAAVAILDTCAGTVVEFHRADLDLVLAKLRDAITEDLTRDRFRARRERGKQIILKRDSEKLN